MTPEERVRKIVSELRYVAPEDEEVFGGKILGGVLAAIREERERCAKAAESFREYGEEMTHRGALCQNIAENIRAGQ